VYWGEKGVKKDGGGGKRSKHLEDVLRSGGGRISGSGYPSSLQAEVEKSQQKKKMKY